MLAALGDMFQGAGAGAAASAAASAAAVQPDAAGQEPTAHQRTDREALVAALRSGALTWEAMEQKRVSLNFTPGRPIFIMIAFCLPDAVGSRPEWSYRVFEVYMRDRTFLKLRPPRGAANTPGITQFPITTTAAEYNRDTNPIIIGEVFKLDRDITAPSAPITIRNPQIRISDVARIIYCCGHTASTRSNRAAIGPSASVVLVVDPATGLVDLSSRHEPQGQEATMQFNAYLAAWRTAQAFAASGIKVIVVSDAQYAIDAWANRRSPAIHSKSGGDECKRLFDIGMRERGEKPQLEDFIFTGSVTQKANYAEPLAAYAAGRQRNLGRSDARFEPTFASAHAAGARRGPAAGSDEERRALDAFSQTIMGVASQVKTVDEFARIRRYRVRNKVPEGAVFQWASVVKHVLQLIVHQGSDHETRSTGVVALLLLPTLFLAQNASLQQISNHLAEARPFNIAINDAQLQQEQEMHARRRAELGELRPLTDLERASRHVEMLVQNGRVKSAVNIMQQNAARAAVAAAAAAAADAQHPAGAADGPVAGGGAAAGPPAGVGADAAAAGAAAAAAAPVDKATREFEASVQALRQLFPQQNENDKPQRIGPKIIRPYSSFEVSNVVRKLPRGAASAIDGWTRDQLVSAINVDPSIGEDLGIVLSWIAMSEPAANAAQQPRYFTSWAMEILRAARLVGVPKQPTGIRPIAISCFLAKLAGALALARAKITGTTLPDQYAIACPNGAQRIVHKVRELYNRGWAIIRTDLSNAYNAVKRKRICEHLLNNLPSDDLDGVRQYFSTMYGVPSTMVCFGPAGRIEKILADEGVRQGDACSSFLFCLVLMRVGTELRERFGEDEAQAFLYMDDGTFAVRDAARAHEAAVFVRTLLTEIGFTVNDSKSSMICKAGAAAFKLEATQDRSALTPPFVVCDPLVDEFKVLGAIVNEKYDKLVNKLRERTDNFFDALGALRVEPYVKNVLLYFCGRPKLLYFASTTPPTFSATTVAHFQRRMVGAFADIIDCDVPSLMAGGMVHRIDGACLPDYVKHAPALYQSSYNAACLGTSSTATKVWLTEHPPAEGEEISPAEVAACAYPWALYNDNTSRLTSAEYRIALALRCGVVPHMPRPFCVKTCTCGKDLPTVAATIQHALACDQLSLIHNTRRHDDVKFALKKVAERYGTQVVVEPAMYRYADGVPHRPDLTFLPHDQLAPLVTDISIVSPTPHAPAGTAAMAKANEKIQQHSNAVRGAGHKFIPFVMETSGHMNGKCRALALELAESLPRYKRAAFARDFLGSAATALASFRVHAVLNALRDEVILPVIRNGISLLM